MLDDHTSFAAMLCASLAFAAWYGHRHGKQYALGAGMAISLLAGTWFEITLFNTPVNVSVATAVILLIVYCTHSWREIFRTINPLDGVIAALLVWHIVVDSYLDGDPLSVAALAYGQWMLPYAAGRYAFLHSNSLNKIAPVFTASVVIISLAAVYESLTSTNLWELIFTTVDDEVARARGMRYGILYRAIGPVRHPIFLGVVLLSMIPFLIEFCSRVNIARNQQITRYAWVIAAVLGIAATVSRGPILCVVIAAGFAIACVSRVARWSLATAAIAGLIAIAVNTDAAIRLFDSEGTGRETSRIIQVDEDSAPAITTSSRHRIFVIQVYGPIFIKGGMLGYGTNDSTGFPPRNLPGLPSDPTMRKQLGIVDNSYINVGLRFGWIGLALFIASFVAAITLSLRLTPVASTYFFPSQSAPCYAFAGTLAAIMLEIATVFWSYDFAFWILFQMGCISGLASQCKLARKRQLEY